MKPAASFFYCECLTIVKEASLLAARSVMAFSAWAQDTSPDTLVIAADRFEQPRSTVLAPIIAMTHQDINRWQSASVNDVLRHLPGVDIAQNDGSDQLSSVFIHGTNASHALVLIDGIRLNLAGVSGSADLNWFPIMLVQRVEHIHGPRSAVYDSGTVGGVMNIVTARDHPRTEISAGWGNNSYQNYNVSTQQQLGSKTRVTLLGDYVHTHGYDVVAYGSTGTQVQPDSDGFLSKTLYGASKRDFTDVWSGFVRGYGYNSRTNYGACCSPGLPLVNTRKLYSQSRGVGPCYNDELIKSRLITSYSHSKNYDCDPHYSRYDSSTTFDKIKQYTVQWAGNIIIDHDNIGTGVDWQEQNATPGAAYAEDGYSQRDTGIYLTGLQQAGNFTFEGTGYNDDDSQLGRHDTWQTSAGWEFIEGYHLITSYGTPYKAPSLGQLYGTYGDPNLNPEKGKQWESTLKGLVAGVNWCISGYHDNASGLVDHNDHTLKYYNEGKARIKGVEVTVNFDTRPLTHTIGYDYVDTRNAVTDTLLLRRAKQQIKYQFSRQLYDFDWRITY